MMLAALLLIGTAGAALSGESDPSGMSDRSEQPESRLQYQTRYRLDSRFMGNSESSSADIMAAEAEISGSYGSKLDFGLQIPLATAMEGRGRDMHFGNAYVLLKGKLRQPTLRAGQFVIPFGNLADYETHTKTFQSLYPNSLGIRIDQGVEAEGYLGEAEYQLAVTNGNGPYRSDIDGNKVVTARVSRRFEMGDDDLKVGVSALKGRLPVFSLMDDPLMDGNDARLVNIDTGEAVGQNDRSGLADKTRFGVDLEYYRGIDLIRAELVTGSDNGRSVNGQWVQVEHPLSYKTSIIGLLQRWEQSTGSFTGWGIGVEHKVRDNRIWRVSYENRRVKESLMDPMMGDLMPMKMSMPMFTVQYLVEF
jgi:hypothetical protein